MVLCDHTVVAALSHTADRQDDHSERSHLHAAAGGTGCRTNELQRAHQQFGDGAAGRKVDGIHARSTSGHRLEQCRHQLARHREPAHAGRIVPLHQRDERRAAEPQDHREAQHHLGLQGKPVLFAVLTDLHPYHETQTAGDDHEHHNGLNIVIVHIGCQ